jgi:hypothetical protein
MLICRAHGAKPSTAVSIIIITQGSESESEIVVARRGKACLHAFLGNACCRVSHAYKRLYHTHMDSNSVTYRILCPASFRGTPQTTADTRVAMLTGSIQHQYHTETQRFPQAQKRIGAPGSNAWAQQRQAPSKSYKRIHSRQQPLSQLTKG